MRRLFLSLTSLLLLGTLVVVGQSSVASAVSPGVTMTLNPNGGTNATDGLKIIYAGGQFMVFREGVEQLYAVNPPDRNTYNQIALAVGDATNGGILFGAGAFLNQAVASNVTKVGWDTVSATTATGFTSNLTGQANGLTYGVTIDVNYVAPENDFEIIYTVDVPDGNTAEIRLYHALDSYLGLSDFGPGFFTPASVCPNGAMSGQVVGVDKSSDGIVEALQYMGGEPWAGYASGAFWEIVDTRMQGGSGLVLGTWGQGVMTDYPDLIDTNPATDNGYGVNWSFGTTPGSYSSTSKFTFSSVAPDPCEEIPAPPPVPTTSTTRGGDPVAPAFTG